jgi:hypothetical protein
MPLKQDFAASAEHPMKLAGTTEKIRPSRPDFSK